MHDQNDTRSDVARDDDPEPIADPDQPELKPLSLRRNFSWTFAGNAAWLGCQFAIIVMLKRFGTDAIVGHYLLALSIAAPLFMFSNLHLRIVQATDASNDFSFPTYLGLRLTATLTALVVVLIGGAIALVLEYPFAAVSAVCLFTVAKSLESVSDILYGRWQTLERFDRISRSLFLNAVAVISAATVTMFVSRSLSATLIAIIAARCVVLFGFDIPAVSRLGVSLRPEFCRHVLGRLTLVGLPLACSALLVSLTTQFPRYMVGGTLGVDALGIFGSIASLIMIGGSITLALNQAAAPRLARLQSANNMSAFRKVAVRVFAVYAVIGTGVTCLVPFIGDWFLATVYDPAWSVYGDVLFYVMIGMTISMLTGCCETGLIALRRTTVLFPLNTLTLVVSAAACAVLIPRFGLVGAGMVVAVQKVPTLVLAAGLLFLSSRPRESSPVESVPFGTAATPGSQEARRCAG